MNAINLKLKKGFLTIGSAKYAGVLIQLIINSILARILSPSEFGVVAIAVVFIIFFQLFRGMVDKYSWVDIGSSYLPSDVQAAYLWGQLDNVDSIKEDRLLSWHYYYNALQRLKHKKVLELPEYPEFVSHNGHMFFIKVKNLEQRTKILAFLKKNDVTAVFHYVPLHSASAGIKYGQFNGRDQYTTVESERLIRLPMYYGLTRKEQQKVIQLLYSYYDESY